ncbi:MAG: hypothetical protein LBJ60_04675 [Tannerellaceae bacterium]|nr:hypothetical protein [Tannerellaceae bacterium]
MGRLSAICRKILRNPDLRQAWGKNRPGRLVADSCREEIRRADCLPTVVGKKSAGLIHCRQL